MTGKMKTNPNTSIQNHYESEEKTKTTRCEQSANRKQTDNQLRIPSLVCLHPNNSNSNILVALEHKKQKTKKN